MSDNNNFNTPLAIFYRCEMCQKKVLCTGKCKCSKYYCEKHRFSHPCSYSHFENHKITLEKRNQKIDADKIIRL